MPIVIPLIDLGTLLVLVGALIFIYLCTYIAKALFGLAGGTLGKLPVVGGWINSGLHTVEHKIVSVMASAAAGVDDAMGFTLHETARLIDWTGREIASHAGILHTIAAAMPGMGFVAALHGQIVALHRLLHGTNATQVAQLRHLLSLEKRLQHGIGDDVLPRLRGLEREVERTIAKDLRGIRARERSLEHGSIQTWKWIRSHPLSLATTAFAGAVAIALQRLGGSWIRCRNWNRIGKEVCGSPLGEIEALIGLLGAGATIASFRELVKLGQEVEHGVTAALQDIAKL